jgi:hypothetical protein
MSYTYQIREALRDYNGTTFKMIEIRIVNSDGKFEHRAYPISINVGSVKSFITLISGNQKELIGYFTVDAFTGLSTSETLGFGYGFESIASIINVNVSNPIPLPPLFSSIPYQIATNAWLQSL